MKNKECVICGDKEQKQCRAWAWGESFFIAKRHSYKPFSAKEIKKAKKTLNTILEILSRQSSP